MTRVRWRPMGVLAVVITGLVCGSVLLIGAVGQQIKGDATSGQRTTSVGATTAISHNAGVLHLSAAAAQQSARTSRAINWVLAEVRYPTRTCLLFVRRAFQLKRKFGTALLAWTHAHYRHRSAISLIPAGVPVFTLGASSSGHVALSLGGGWVRTIDWPRDGLVGTVRLTTLLKKWHHHYLGWSEDLNGVRIWQP